MLGVIGVMIGFQPMLVAAATNYAGDYPSLTNAIANSANGDTIIITNNITVSNQVSMGVGLTIQGNNRSISVPVPGLNASGVVNSAPSGFGVFSISATGMTNTIQSLTIEGGAPSGSGGGILLGGGTLLLQGVTVSQSGGASTTGGGIAVNAGALFMNGCNISRNGAQYGGGFLNYGTMFIQDCTFSENRSMSGGGGGGGGENDGTLYANNSTFANNISTELGGGINNHGGTLYCVDCTFVGNVAYGTGFMGGAIANNSGAATLVNSLFAYNYHYSGSAFSLNDITVYSGSDPVAYYCIFQSTTNLLGTGSAGTTFYTGNISGTNNTLFCGGANAMVLGPGGSQVGSSTIYQPFLANVGSSQTPSAVLQPGSFAIGNGARAAFSSAPSTPVVGYYNGSAWVSLSGTSPASYEITTDQNGTSRGSALTVGAVNSTASNVFMLQVNAPTNGSVSGGTIYGDIYPSGTVVTLTAIPNAGYQFSQWIYVLGGSGIASTANPFAITLTTNVTLVPVFAAYTGFTISYSGNGSTGGSVPSAQVVGSGGSTNISAAGTMVRSGYLFSSWNTRSDGNGTIYSPNAAYSGPGNLNLYATWALIPSPAVTTWPTASAISYGQTLASSTLSGGIASVGGVFAFTAPAIAPGAGTASQGVTFTPTDTTNFTSVSGTASVTVNQALAMVSLHPAPPLLATFDGTAKSVTATTTPSGLTVTITYNGQSAAPTNAGIYNLLATITDSNYYGGISTQLRIAMAGPAVAWGLGTSGQLGNGALTNSTVPVAIITSGVLAGKTITAVAGGVDHSYALTSDGLVYAWGDDSLGQLGDNGTGHSDVPVMVYTNGVLSGKRITAIVSGQSHALALSADGKLFAWGWNMSLQLGNGTSVASTNVPVAVDMSGVLAGKTVVALGAGNMHNLVATSDGSLFAWGYGENGQLGNGAMTNSGTPVAVNMSGALSGKSVIAASGGWEHSVALTADGLVYAWGYGDLGQFGNGAFTNSSLPVAVSTNGALSGKTVVAIGSGEFHCLAVGSDGRVYSWGPNPAGELGNGTNLTSSLPVAVSTNGALFGKYVVAVCGNYDSSTALTIDGEVFTWGANGNGELGNPAYPTNSYVPVPVITSGPLAGQTVLAISSSSQAYHTIALTVGLSAPALTSATNATGAYGQAFSFTVTGNNVAGYSATGLPGWLAFNTNTGNLSGTPANAGIFDVTIVASNAFGTTSSNLAITIAPGVTTVSVGSSLAPATYGASVTFTATVSPSAASGTVTFTDGGTNIGSGTLGGGSALYATGALTAGSHSIIATYASNANFTGSTSAALTQTINQAETALLLVASPNPSVPGSNVTFTATVTSMAPATAMPAGSVQFFANDMAMGDPIPLTLGVANISSASLPNGSNDVQAVYAGDANLLASINMLTQVVSTHTVGQRPIVVGIANNGNASMTATFQGTVGASYIVFVTTNLAAPALWSAVATNMVGPGGTWTYTESTAAWQDRFFLAAPAQ
jgi:uncharacterized repeat protein (TIGR02543 family)